MKVVELANSIDPDKAAHDEPPYLNLDCYQFLDYLNILYPRQNVLKFCRQFIVSSAFFVALRAE